MKRIHRLATFAETAEAFPLLYMRARARARATEGGANLQMFFGLGSLGSLGKRKKRAGKRMSWDGVRAALGLGKSLGMAVRVSADGRIGR